MKLRSLTIALSTTLACMTLAACNVSGVTQNSTTYRTPVGWVYSTLYSQNAIMAIDNVQSRIQPDPIPVSNGPVNIAIDPRGQQNYLYVVCKLGDAVDVVDRRSNLRVRTISVGSQPYGIAISPDGTRAFVTNSGADTVSIIDLNQRTVLQTVQLNPLTSNAQPTQGQPTKLTPMGIATNYNGTHVFVVCETGRVVVLTAPSTTGQYTVGGNVLLTNAVQPENIAVDSTAANPSTEMVYVTDPRGDNLFYFNGATGNQTAQALQLNGSPEGVAVGVNPASVQAGQPTNDMLYVTASAGNALYALPISASGPSGGTGGGVQVEGTDPTSIAVSPLGDQVFVSLSGNNTVEVFQRQGQALARPQQFDISQFSAQYISPTGALALGSHMY